MRVTSVCKNGIQAIGRVAFVAIVVGLGAPACSSTALDGAVMVGVGAVLLADTDAPTPGTDAVETARRDCEAGEMDACATLGASYEFGGTFFCQCTDDQCDDLPDESWTLQLER